MRGCAILATPTSAIPQILAHLEAENAYFAQTMAPHAAFVERLHDELKARIKSDDHSVPVRDGAFEFHWRFFDGAQYRTWFRRGLGEPEARVVLDERELAAGKNYFQLRALDTSPDGRLLAYTTDEDGSERFGLHLKDLSADTTLGDLVTNISGAMVWAEDGQTLLYVELNDQLRPFRVQGASASARRPRRTSPSTRRKIRPSSCRSARR